MISAKDLVALFGLASVVACTRWQHPDRPVDDELMDLLQLSSAAEFDAVRTRVGSRCAWARRSLTYEIGTPPPTLDRSDFERIVERSLQQWVQGSTLQVARFTGPGTPDLLFTRVSDPYDPLFEADQFAYADFPPGCIPNRRDGLPRRVVLVETPGSHWVQAGTSVTGPLTPPAFDVETAVLHEAGHALGVWHCEDARGVDVECRTANSVMHSAKYYGHQLRTPRRSLYDIDRRRIAMKYP